MKKQFPKLSVLALMLASLTMPSCNNAPPNKSGEKTATTTSTSTPSLPNQSDNIHKIRKKIHKSKVVEIYNKIYGNEEGRTQAAYYTSITNGDPCIFKYDLELYRSSSNLERGETFSFCTYYVPIDKLDINKVEESSNYLRLSVKYGKKLIKRTDGVNYKCIDSEGFADDAYLMVNNMEESIDLFREYVNACQSE